MAEIYKDILENVYTYTTYEKDEYGRRGYRIFKNGDRYLNQYDEFIKFPNSGSLEQSAIKHIQEIIDNVAEAEKERISIENLQKQIDKLKTENEELKKINAEQDTMLAELAML